MYRLFHLGPVLPATLTLLNVVNFAQGMALGRFKPNAARFALAYAATILPAARGDLSPFIQVMTIPY